MYFFTKHIRITHTKEDRRRNNRKGPILDVTFTHIKMVNTITYSNTSLNSKDGGYCWLIASFNSMRSITLLSHVMCVRVFNYTFQLLNFFSVRKRDLLGGRRPPLDILAGPRPAHDSWGDRRPPKSSFFLTEKNLRKLKNVGSVKYCITNIWKVL